MKQLLPVFSYSNSTLVGICKAKAEWEKTQMARIVWLEVLSIHEPRVMMNDSRPAVCAIDLSSSHALRCGQSTFIHSLSHAYTWHWEFENSSANFHPFSICKNLFCSTSTHCTYIHMARLWESSRHHYGSFIHYVQNSRPAPSYHTSGALLYHSAAHYSIKQFSSFDAYA